MTTEQWLHLATSKLRSVQIQSARLDSELILVNVLMCSTRTKLLSLLNLTLTNKQLLHADELLSIRLKYTPMAHILKETEFYGLKLKVSPQVLIPRPETEELVYQAIQGLPKKAKVIDIGTGSGAIALAIKNNRLDINITGVDNSSEALNVAESNIKNTELDISTSILDIKKDIIPADITHIVANLPYLPLASTINPEAEHEPKKALFSGKDGLDHYRHLFNKLGSNIQAIYLEAEPYQQIPLTEIAANAGYKLTKLRGWCYIFNRSK